MKTVFNLRSIAATTLIIVSGLAAAESHLKTQKPEQIAAPFGLEIGRATCAEAQLKLGETTSRNLGDNDLVLKAKNPSTLFPGASNVTVRCSKDRVIALLIRAPKGGLENEEAKEAFSQLKDRYKLFGGNTMPSLGNGYARFKAANSIIEQEAPHLSFDFTVTYFEPGFYEQRVADDTKAAKESLEKKRAAF